jgi:hypothetical protein
MSLFGMHSIVEWVAFSLDCGNTDQSTGEARGLYRPSIFVSLLYSSFARLAIPSRRLVACITNHFMHGKRGAATTDKSAAGGFLPGVLSFMVVIGHGSPSLMQGECAAALRRRMDMN